MKKLLRYSFLVAIVLTGFTGFVRNANAQTTTTLIHYWNFNTLTAKYTHPNIPHIPADYTAEDSAYLEYYLLPGTSATWAISGPDSNNDGGVQIDNVAGDTTNARQGAIAGTGIRFRNPTDSAEIRWHIPSTGFSNLVVKYATQTSSEASGDSVQDYSYSVDGGKTWDSTGMTVNGAPGHTLDLTQGGNVNTPYLSYVLTTITFGTVTTVNSNPNLIFRIIFRGHTDPGFPVTGGVAVSGNNRFDNFTLDGVGSAGPPPPPPDVITMISPVPSGGNIFVPGQKTLISFHASSTTGKNRTIKFSPDSVTWSNVGTVTDAGDTTYTWTVPNTAATKGYVSVTDDSGVTANAGPFIIAIPSTPNLLVDYWAFNTLNTTYYTPNVPNLPADFSGESTPGYIQYVNHTQIPKYSYIDYVNPGATVNAQFGAPAGNALRVRNPTDSMELHFVIPTTGFKGITISYGLQASSFTGPQKEFFSYSPDGGSSWIASGLMVDGVLTDSLSLLDSIKYQAGFGLVTIGFNSTASAMYVDNNPQFIFRITFGDTATHGTSGNNRFDNLTVTAASIVAPSSVNQPVQAQQQLSLSPNPATDNISFQNPYGSPVTVSVLNTLGQEVLRSSGSASGTMSVNTSELSAGTYYLHIQNVTTGAEQMAKFIKQ
jgi:hypothetical protein